MKLSERKGDEVLDIVADLIDPICAIAEDSGELFKQSEASDGKDDWESLLVRIRKAMPSVIRNHKNELVQILAAVNGKTPDEYREGMTFSQLLKDVYDLITDKELIPFFDSSAEEESLSN